MADDVGSLVNLGVIAYLTQLLDTGFFHAVIRMRIRIMRRMRWMRRRSHQWLGHINRLVAFR